METLKGLTVKSQLALLDLTLSVFESHDMICVCAVVCSNSWQSSSCWSAVLQSQTMSSAIT